MIEFIVIHDTLIGPSFPYETLEQFSFITVKTRHINMFKDEITITIQKERPDITNSEIYTTIFGLGKLVGQTMYMN